MPDGLKKIISFSLWGLKSKYLNGAKANLELSKEIYPGWTCRFYCAPDSAAVIGDELRNNGAEVYPVLLSRGTFDGMYWRFGPASDADVSIMLSRDCDSRLNPREKACVDEWLASDKPFHAIRDNREHTCPILGGLWGVKNPFLKDMTKWINEWGKYHRYGIDQDFLTHYVWPLVKNGRHICHDELHQYSGPDARPFPKVEMDPARFGTFCGEIFNV